MNQNRLDIDILSLQNLKEIPSASGIIKFKDSFYVIGDDSPYLFQIDKNFSLLSKSLIYVSDKLQVNTIPKINKPDFEAMERISDTEILVFGSGSKSPERDVCILVEIGEEVTYKQYDISLLYEYIRGLEIMRGYELDIEGLAIYGELLYLFNRGRNILFSFPYMAFISYCLSGTHFPTPKVKLYTLPEINGLQAGFSGATSYGQKPYLIFTASVEDAPNSYDDGDILGSFIGIIAINNGVPSNDFIVEKIPNPGTPLKVESVIVDKILSETEAELILVTDNDGKPSEILRLRMTFNPEIKE